MGENITLNCSMRNRDEVAWYLLRSDELVLLISGEKDKTGRKLLTTYNQNRARMKMTADSWATGASLTITGVTESDSGLYFYGIKSDSPEMHFDKPIRLDIEDSVPWSVALRDGVVLKAVAVDVFLLVLFSFQHSVLAWAPVKSVCQRVFGVLSRTVYCFTTAAALQLLMQFWQPVTGAPCLWSVRSAPWDIWFPLLCFVIHFLCWAVICSILLIFDYPELMGLKQVYYECLGLGDPLLLKSERAQRLYSHLRHPVCVELLTVLWLLPSLPLDRLVLALFLSLYLALAHSLDAQDCVYLRRQLQSKLQIFSTPLEGSERSASHTHKTQ
ncbi:nurim-like isoform X2 [Pimephales promelas]|nr:nurim-like isoform X2 [Pimephales promelas]XP_039546967.1 nurim-like isoform X2 [Pimephales promelas]XP_039546968.1 nurim-like isoform X2 [Pimephales promelas]